MRNENFAERLFCDLRNKQIKIEMPEYWQEGAKIGMIENSIQFNICGIRDKYSCGVGPTFQDELTHSFTDAYTEFFTKIKDMGNHIKFHSLVVPSRAVIEARLEEFEKVVSRYIVDYLPSLDEKLERWDVMVQKL